MDLFTWFLTPEFIALCFIVYALVWAQRRLVEYVFYKLGKDIKKSKLWRSFLLPAGPIGTGALLTWIVTSFPYPEVFAASVVGRIGYGILAGFASMQIYRFGKEWFSGKFKALKKANESEKEETQPSVSE